MNNYNRREVPYLPLRTIVKFYDNHDEGNHNKLMTKTLMKTGFIDNEWIEQQQNEAPQTGEFWLVDVVHETCVGKPRGCFLLRPIRRVDSNTLSRLLPGMYTEERYSGCILLEPESGGINWILPLTYKQSVKDIHIYAAIVKQ